MNTFAPPTLVLVLALEGDEPRAYLDAAHEGDELRLRRWVEASRHRDALERLVPCLFVATGAAA